MTRMSPTTLVQRRANLTIEIDSFGATSIWGGHQPIRVAHSGLRVLDYFGRPRKISDAIRECEQGVASKLEAEGWIQSVFALLEAGVLVTDTKYHTLLVPSPMGFDVVPIHARMIEDKQRTKAFIEAVRRTVGSGDVVVDLGTGTGILAAAAARAGARRVFGIEAGQMASLAQKVAERNDERRAVEIIQGFSFGIDLPERGSVLVSEILGNDPFEEDILPIFDDAQRRLLVPGAKLIPSRVRLYAFPTVAPLSFLSRNTFNPKRMRDLSTAYGVDLTSLSTAVSGIAHPASAAPGLVRRWATAATPQLLLDVDLQNPSLLVPSVDAIFAVEERPFNALCLYFEADLAEGISVSTSPFLADPTCSWNVMLWMLHDWPVRQGETTFRVTVENQKHVRVAMPLNHAMVFADGATVG